MKIHHYLLLIFALAGLDQLSKYWVLSNMDIGLSIYLIPNISLTHVHNYGAAFSFLAGEDGWQVHFLTGVSTLVIFFLLDWLRKTTISGENTLGLGLALMIAGALGNLIDRIYHGFVVDFISIHHNTFYFPVFNIADILISIAILIILTSEFKK